MSSCGNTNAARNVVTCVVLFWLLHQIKTLVKVGDDEIPRKVYTLKAREKQFVAMDISLTLVQLFIVSSYTVQ